MMRETATQFTTGTPMASVQVTDNATVESVTAGKAGQVEHASTLSPAPFHPSKVHGNAKETLSCPAQAQENASVDRAPAFPQGMTECMGNTASVMIASVRTVMGSSVAGMASARVGGVSAMMNGLGNTVKFPETAVCRSSRARTCASLPVD